MALFNKTNNLLSFFFFNIKNYLDVRSRQIDTNDIKDNVMQFNWNL